MPFTPFVEDPELDLVLARDVALAPALVWRAWTEPDLLRQWFCPKPYETPFCSIDLRPGGEFRTVLRSPEGEESDNTGCYLELIAGERLVWTSALGPGYRPLVAAPDELQMTGIIELTAIDGGGTRYRAMARHGEKRQRDRHEAMGFTQGWGVALDQLVALMSSP